METISNGWTTEWERLRAENALLKQEIEDMRGVRFTGLIIGAASGFLATAILVGIVKLAFHFWPF